MKSGPMMNQPKTYIINLFYNKYMKITKINSIKIGLFARFFIHYAILYLPISIGYKVILILLSDILDCNVVKLVKYFNNLQPDDSYCKHFLYQISDKLLDSISYLIIYHLLKLPKIYLFLICYRLVGVGLFYITLNSQYLIFFPDLFKELLAYQYLFKNIDSGVFIVVFLKVLFEIFWHNMVNKNIYKFNNKLNYI